MELKDFDGAHAGEDVWVVGSDKSLDWFPDSFFDNRIVVAVNGMPTKVPAQYCVTKADTSGEWVQKQADSLPDVIHIVSKHPNGDPFRGLSNVKGKNIITFNHAANKCERFVPGADIPNDSDSLLVSWSTLGSAMHFAARLGARTVFMVGVSGGRFSDRGNLSGYYGEQTDPGPIEGMSRQTQPIADRLRAMYGTEFVTVLPWANLRCGGTKFRSDYGRLNDA